MSVDYANDTQERAYSRRCNGGTEASCKTSAWCTKVGSPSALDEILRAVMIVSS